MNFTEEIIGLYWCRETRKNPQQQFHQEMDLSYYSNYEHGINIRI